MSTKPKEIADDDEKKQNIDELPTIVAIELYEVFIPFVQVYTTALGSHAGRTNIICKLITSKSDLYGWGEASPHPPKFTTESVKSVWELSISKIFPLIRGQSAVKIDEVDELINKNIDDSGIIAKGMINMALWDIYGKYYNKPVYKCLAERYTNGKIYNKKTTLLYPFSDQTIEQDTKMMTEKMDQGYATFMLKMGLNKDIDYQIKRVQNVEKKFGPIGEKVFIVIDANQGFTYDEASKLISGIGGIKLTSFEQPINKSQNSDLKKLKEECLKAGFNLSLDESVQDYVGIKYCIDNEIGSMFSLKVSKNGGITNMFKVCELADKAGISILFNSMLEFGVTQAALLQVFAVTKNIVNCGHCFMSTLRFKYDVTDFSSQISMDKIVSLNNKSGLGINVDENKLKAWSVNMTYRSQQLSTI